MTPEFDPYHRWLGIPAKYQPPDHYRLLAIERFEDDQEVIRDAAEARIRHVRTYELGEQSALAQKILNELAGAKACLLDSDKKAAYDEQLRAQAASASGPLSDVGTVAGQGIGDDSVADVIVTESAADTPADDKATADNSAPAARKETMPLRPRAAAPRSRAKSGRPTASVASAAAGGETDPRPLVDVEPAQRSVTRTRRKRGRPTSALVWYYVGGGGALLLALILVVALAQNVEDVPQRAGPPLAKAPFDVRQAKQHQAEWSQHVQQPVEITNSIGMKLTLIPPCEFLMGSPEDEEDHQSNEAQHRVRITGPFWLGVYEVTQEQFKPVMGSNPSYFSSVSSVGEGRNKTRGQDTRRFPVEQVSWNDATEFCRRLSGIAEERRKGFRYRLPTEAEWEYACRAGTTTPFHFGSQLNGREANCNGRYPYGTSQKGPYLQSTTTVGSYVANGFGLHDTHGNVWELCADWYDEDYYGVSPLEDPQGPDRGSARVRRGGSWSSTARGCQSSRRGWFSPTYRNDDLGFRLALVASGE